MEPKIVERAEMAPAKCAVTGDIDGPFVDTGCWCPNTDPYIYLHVPWVKQIARDLLGMVPEEEIAELRAKVAELQEQVSSLSAATDALEELEKALGTVE